MSVTRLLTTHSYSDLLMVGFAEGCPSVLLIGSYFDQRRVIIGMLSFIRGYMEYASRRKIDTSNSVFEGLLRSLGGLRAWFLEFTCLSTESEVPVRLRSRNRANWSDTYASELSCER